MTTQRDVVHPGESVYLFLPLAHSFAQLVVFTAVEVGATVAFWQKDPQKIISDLLEVKPTYFPSVPRIFEKIYTLAHSNAEDPEALAQAVSSAARWPRRQEPASRCRRTCSRPSTPPTRSCSSTSATCSASDPSVRDGAAPIAQEISSSSTPAASPIMEGYGMTETSTSRTVNTVEEHRFGSVASRSRASSVKIAEDGEVLISGPNIFKAYYKNDEATNETVIDGWLHTGDLGRLDDDGYLYITGRKKDIIITAGGKKSRRRTSRTA